MTLCAFCPNPSKTPPHNFPKVPKNLDFLNFHVGPNCLWGGGGEEPGQSLVELISKGIGLVNCRPGVCQEDAVLFCK